MYFTCRSFIGKSPSGNWSQYWENEPDDPLTTSHRGHLFGLINLSVDSDSKKASQLGHQIIDHINQLYFSDTNATPLQQLKSSLDSFVSDFVPQTSNITLILAVIFEQKLHLAVYHLGHCILKRDNQISSILTGQKQKITTISGPIQSKDCLFLSTDSFLQKITWAKIKSTLSQDSTQEIEEDMLSSLYSFQDQTNLSAAFIQVQQDEDISPNQLSDQIADQQPLPVPQENTISAPNSLPTQNSDKQSDSLPKIPFAKLLFPKKDIYIPHHQIKRIRQRKKLNIIIALVLLLALTVSAFFGFRKNQAIKAEDNYLQLVQEISKQIETAHTVKNLSLDSALKSAQDADSLLTQVKQLNLHPDKIAILEQEIKKLLSQTGSSHSLDIQLFRDTSVITSNPQYSQMIFQSSILYLVDKSFGRIDALNVEQKSNKNISISDDIKSTVSLVESNNIIYLLTKTGVSRLEKTDTIQKIKFSDQLLSSTPIDIQSWNSALYILTKDSVIKFTPSGADFSTGSSWLKPDQSLPQDTTSFAINGKIWILSSTGQLAPFVRGQKDTFKASQETDITNTDNLITTMDNELLAFTQDSNIVYVYKKDGQIASKYNLGDLTINDIAIDEATNTLYILCTDQKIYQINISN